MDKKSRETTNLCVKILNTNERLVKGKQNGYKFGSTRTWNPESGNGNGNETRKRNQ